MICLESAYFMVINGNTFDQKGLLILHVFDGSRWYTDKVVVQ